MACQAVQKAIELLPVSEYLAKFNFTVQLPFDMVSDVERLIANSGATIVNRVWESELKICGEGTLEQLLTLEQSFNSILHKLTYSSDKAL